MKPKKHTEAKDTKSYDVKVNRTKGLPKMDALNNNNNNKRKNPTVIKKNLAQVISVIYPIENYINKLPVKNELVCNAFYIWYEWKQIYFQNIFKIKYI